MQMLCRLMVGLLVLGGRKARSVESGAWKARQGFGDAARSFGRGCRGWGSRHTLVCPGQRGGVLVAGGSREAAGFHELQNRLGARRGNIPIQARRLRRREGMVCTCRRIGFAVQGTNSRTQIRRQKHSFRPAQHHRRESGPLGELFGI